MSSQGRWIIASKFLVTFFALAIGSAVHAADRGKTTGVAAFRAHGKTVEYTPSVAVWQGKFVGVSKTTSGKGPLHNAGWECTGETTIYEGTVYQSDGFCVVIDSDGDAINLVWEQTDTPMTAGTAKTKGTYLSGTGKYSGIQGYYTFACNLGGAMANCDITAGEYTIP